MKRLKVYPITPKEMNQIIQGDCLDKLKELKENSIDLVCTDPPYGYSFMGKDWDKAVPSVDVWQECLRVLKPGGFAFVMSAPRSDVCSRMCLRLEEAGFVISFTPIYWTYASGFPKAMNIGKMVDKRGGAYFGKELCELIKKKRLELGYSTIKLAELGGFYGKVNHGGSVSNWEEGKGTPTLEQYNKLIEILGLSGEPIVETQREVLSKQNVTFGVGGDSKRLGGEFETTKGNSPFEGSYGGFQPKPAVEVIIVAMKPLSEKTYVDQALKNGKGITWLDDCRIPCETRFNAPATPKEGTFNCSFDSDYQGQEVSGRFPANLLVSDDVLNDGVERKVGAVRPYTQANTDSYSGSMPTTRDYEKPADIGSYSRYFDLDKWWEAKTLPEGSAADSKYNTLPFLIVAKASKSEKNRGLDCYLTVKYNSGICKGDNMVAVQLLKRVTSDTEVVNFSIDESGENIMAQCHKDSLSTTLTTINEIIESKTLNSLMLLHTNGFIQDVNSEVKIGGNPAESVESLSKYLQTITNGNQESARGVSNAVLQMLLEIKEKENWQEHKNIHSTVKPLKLMSYLITLGSREGDTVLDPFAGSCTTLVAAKELKRNYIGIEREQEYINICNARLEAVPNTLF